MRAIRTAQLRETKQVQRAALKHQKSKRLEHDQQIETLKVGYVRECPLVTYMYMDGVLLIIVVNSMPLVAGNSCLNTRIILLVGCWLPESP